MAKRKHVEKKHVKKSGEGLGISGFTLGIMSIVLVVFSPLLGILVAIVGFVLSLVQQNRNPTKYGKLGVILNVAGFILNILWWVFLITYLLPILQEQLQNSLI